MATKGTIIFKGDIGAPEGHYGKGQIVGVSDAAALTVFAAFMIDHSDCNVAKESFVSAVLGTDLAPGLSANVDRRATVYFRDPTDLTTHSFSYPAPAAADVEDKPQGERLTDVAVAAIVAAINLATGKSYTPQYGIVTQKR